MSTQERVLIIEDDTSLRDRIYKIVNKAGYDVDVAGTKAEALEKIRCRTYHVVMIDIMLTDDPSDRGGIDCLEYIGRLNEGTEAVVVSATNDVRVPVEVWKKGALTYLVKKDIRSSKDILDALGEALKKCELNLYGPFSSLTAYLAHPEKVYLLEHDLMKIIGSDISRVYNIMGKVFEPILPVLRSREHKFPLKTDIKEKRITSLLWSKAVGGAVWISFSSDLDNPIEPPEYCHPIKLLLQMADIQKWQGKVKIWHVTRPRDNFEESLFEKR